MRIAITKIGANITFSNQNASAANADILYALRTLGAKRNEITIVTHKTRNTQLPKVLKFQEIQDTRDFNKFDCVLVFNGAYNFFGGAEDPNLIALYKALSNTAKRIFYVQTDGAMYFQKLWPLIEKREWAQKYNSAMFHVNPGNVVYLTQGRNLDKMYDKLDKVKNKCGPSQMFHFPWERTILTAHEKHFTKPLIPHADREYDLAFGGATRNSYKRKKIEKYYNSPKLKTLLFGNLRGVTAPNADMKPKVGYQQMIPTMMKARGTVIFGDELYNNNFHTLRIYESLLAGCLVMFDKEFNPAWPFVVDDIDMVEFIMNESIAKVEELAMEMRANAFEAFQEDNLREVLNELIRKNR